ncbi:MAG: peptide chain release factor N(5)-glutamine methyltransferase [Ruminococcus sp.]|nr:peptide chain release factor N(5)-glutamine methyltransferase [Ruminococcus sp.]
MTIKEAFNFTKQELIKAGVSNPAFDAIYIFEHVFSLSRTDITIYGDKEVESEKLSKLSECIRRRKNNEPVQYIIGKWYFMGNEFKVSSGVLIPRDDTEVLVRACMELLDGKASPVIADLCSGSGIIAVILKQHFADATVYAVEKSDIAYSFLCENAKHNNTEIKTLHADLYDCVDTFEDNSLDLLVSNPPYIISDEISSLQKEVQFEPKLALDGGEDGYSFYRGIIEHYPKKLKKGGIIAFEIGEGQFEYIKKLLENASFKDVRGYLDLGNTVRAVIAIYNP